jgi:hypothetical protein
MDAWIVSMMIGSGTTLFTAALSALVAVRIYRRGERVHGREAAREQQRLTVVRMLDTVGAAVRTRSSPALFRRFQNANVDTLLALPRLLVELPNDDLAVATWSATQVQRALQATRRKPFVARMMTLETQLIAWHRGDVSTAWFVAELEKEPFDPNFRISRATRMETWAYEVLETVAILGTARFLQWTWRRTTH